MEKNRSSRETIATHHIQDGIQHHLQTDPGGPVVVLDGSGHGVELIVSGQFQVVQNRLVAAVAQQRESVCSGEKKQNIRSEPSSDVIFTFHSALFAAQQSDIVKNISVCGLLISHQST